jgi:TorA maturation chaperone TorD
MATYSHQFVENYDGLMAFGLDRQTDEQTLTAYLQKFSDDHLLEVLLPRLNQDSLNRLFEEISTILRENLKHEEYHRLFLKEGEG